MKADTYFASQIILLLGTLYFKLAWYTLLPNSLCFSTHYITLWHTILLSTFYFSVHFATGFFFSSANLANLASWNTLLPRTLCILWSREQIMLWRTFYRNMFQGEMCSKEQSVQERQMCLGANCFWKQNVPGMIMYWETNFSEEQSLSLKSVPRSKVCVSRMNYGEQICGLRTFFGQPWYEIWLPIPKSDIFLFLSFRSQTILVGSLKIGHWQLL